MLSACRHSASTILPCLQAAARPALSLSIDLIGASNSINSCTTSSFPRRHVSTEATQCVLLRDFIQTSLYHPVHGYFSARKPPVGKISKGLDFSKLTGELEYKMQLQAMYKELQTSWLTPAEIFKPYYGKAIARYLLEHHKHNLKGKGPLHIFEVGGGTGTLANNVMDYVKEKAPALYKSMQYTCLEISPSLAGLQQAAAKEGGHTAQFKSVRGDAAEQTSWEECRVTEHSFVLMMEVLDNLPHDRIVRAARKRPWAQTLVCEERSMSGIQIREQLEPVNDSLIQRCIDAGVVDSVVGTDSLIERIAAMATGIDKLIWGTGEEVVFVPTRCLALLDTLHSQLPDHTLLAADFDMLPDVRVKGFNAPLVTSTRDGRNHDWDTIYVQSGSADIFFPTNFDALKKLYIHAAQTQQTNSTGEAALMDVKHVSSTEFMMRLADMTKTSTLSGYNPLLQDYTNTRFLIASNKHKLK